MCNFGSKPIFCCCRHARNALPSCIARAAAYGIPVFTTDTGGIANYVVNGVNGYRLPLTGTGADFANKIKECICKQEFSGLSENARRLYKEKIELAGLVFPVC